MTTQLIIALDFDQQSSALKLIEQLHILAQTTQILPILKIGSEMFTLFGADFVKTLVSQGFKIFLDLKFHDIPNTVSHACLAAAQLGVWMLNVHASGGLQMMTTAMQQLQQQPNRPLLIAVTILTSFVENDLQILGINASLEDQVIRLTKLTCQAGLDGIVCSALEVPLIKQLCGPRFLTITPGIRLDNQVDDDQMRVTTVQQAKTLGSDFIVVGRPITRSAAPLTIINEIYKLLYE